jgi:hypothetical protein
MSLVYQAANVKAPVDTGSNETTVIWWTAETTHKANAVPSDWCGKYVTMYAIGGVVDFFFSTSSSAEVNRGATAADAGERTKTGGKLADGIEKMRQIRIPVKEPSATMYFVRESDTASTVVVMELSSD